MFHSFSDSVTTLECLILKKLSNSSNGEFWEVSSSISSVVGKMTKSLSQTPSSVSLSPRFNPMVSGLLVIESSSVISTLILWWFSFTDCWACFSTVSPVSVSLGSEMEFSGSSTETGLLDGESVEIVVVPPSSGKVSVPLGIEATVSSWFNSSNDSWTSWLSFSSTNNEGMINPGNISSWKIQWRMCSILLVFKLYAIISVSPWYPKKTPGVPLSP